MKRPITEIDLDKNKAGILARLEKLDTAIKTEEESASASFDLLEKLQHELKGDENVEIALENISSYEDYWEQLAELAELKMYIEEEYTGGIRLEDDDVLTMELPFEENMEEEEGDDDEEFLFAFNEKGELAEVYPLTITFDSEKAKDDFEKFTRTPEFVKALEDYFLEESGNAPAADDPLERVCTQFIESMERLKKEALSKQDEPYYSGKFCAYSEASRDLRKLLRKEKGL